MTINLRSTPLRTAPPGGLHLEVAIPERFELQFLGPDDKWWGEGVSTRAHTNTISAEGGATGISFGSATPIILRCVEDHPDHLVCLDGGGKRHIYRLLSLPE